MEAWKVEGLLRILSSVVCAVTACLVRFDRQTKVMFTILTRKATFRDLDALCVMVWIYTAAAVYNVIQVMRASCCCKFLPGLRKESLTGSPSYRYLAWGVYILDQAITYVVFASNTTAMQASVLAVTGEKNFQWMKLCDKFTRFCIQIGSALLCGYVAAILMVITSSFSACSLFRLYSPKHILKLKGK